MSEAQNNPTPHAAELRDALALLIARAGKSLEDSSKSSPSLQRYQELVRLYDLASKREDQGCIFAVYGSPNMGKSTLLNSLLDEAVLPVKPIPTTGSVIDLRVNHSREDYEVICKDCQGTLRRNLFKESEGVCDFLNRYATQDSPFQSVCITGPFPNAQKFLTEGCTLRDTPGAEALLDRESGRVIDERLRADSEKALASISKDMIPLFCVSSDTLGQQQDMDFYDKYFRNRCCLHILTRIDQRTKEVGSQEALDAINDFCEKFNIIPSADHPKPVVCTGIDGKAQGQRFVNLGLEELEKEMLGFISPARLETTLLELARFILDNKGQLDFPVNEVYAAQLDRILKQYDK